MKCVQTRCWKITWFSTICGRLALVSSQNTINVLSHTASVALRGEFGRWEWEMSMQRERQEDLLWVTALAKQILLGEKERNLLQINILLVTWVEWNKKTSIKATSFLLLRVPPPACSSSNISPPSFLTCIFPEVPPTRLWAQLCPAGLATAASSMEKSSLSSLRPPSAPTASTWAPPTTLPQVCEIRRASFLAVV